MKKTGIIFIFGCLVSMGLTAQTKPVDASGIFSPHAPALFSTPVFNSVPITAVKPLDFKYQPPKLPFFCSMEDKFRKKCNVFLKLRAGDDDAYEKMIKVIEH